MSSGFRQSLGYYIVNGRRSVDLQSAALSNQVVANRGKGTPIIYVICVTGNGKCLGTGVEKHSNDASFIKRH